MLTKQYPDLIISSPRLEEDKKTLTFGVISLLNEQNIDYKLNEYFTMFISPFDITKFYISKPNEATGKLTEVSNITDAVSATIRKGIHEIEIDQSKRDLLKQRYTFSDGVRYYLPEQSEKLGYIYGDNVSATNELRKLANLKNDGVITEEEFQKMKQAIIEKALQPNT